MGEFEPKDDDYVGDIHDGLEMMVRQEDMPIGTPGGKKEDLRRGAFVDGVKHEHGGGSCYTCVARVQSNLGTQPSDSSRGTCTLPYRQIQHPTALSDRNMQCSLRPVPLLAPNLHHLL